MTDMPRLEISVYRSDSIGYRVELRFTEPQNSDAEDRISGVAHFDLDHLRTLGLDAPAYGHELTNSLFADLDVRDMFAIARGRAFLGGIRGYSWCSWFNCPA